MVLNDVVPTVDVGDFGALGVPVETYRHRWGAGESE
jgi:hypothetical protein